MRPVCARELVAGLEENVGVMFPVGVVDDNEIVPLTTTVMEATPTEFTSPPAWRNGIADEPDQRMLHGDAVQDGSVGIVIESCFMIMSWDEKIVERLDHKGRRGRANAQCIRRERRRAQAGLDTGRKDAGRTNSAEPVFTSTMHRKNIAGMFARRLGTEHIT